MQIREKQRHIIDFLFPLTLFLVFTLSALIILLLSADIYRSTVVDSSRNDTARTAISYVSEKVHQQDVHGQVNLGEFDGQPALILTSQVDGVSYYTYIYEYNHELKELFLKEDGKAPASSGKTILEVEYFTMKETPSGLLSFRCTDKSGHTSRLIVSLKSR